MPRERADRFGPLVVNGERISDRSDLCFGLSRFGLVVLFLHGVTLRLFRIPLAAVGTFTTAGPPLVTARPFGAASPRYLTSPLRTRAIRPLYARPFSVSWRWANGTPRFQASAAGSFFTPHLRPTSGPSPFWASRSHSSHGGPLSKPLNHLSLLFVEDPIQSLSRFLLQRFEFLPLFTVQSESLDEKGWQQHPRPKHRPGGSGSWAHGAPGWAAKTSGWRPHRAPSFRSSFRFVDFVLSWPRAFAIALRRLGQGYRAEELGCRQSGQQSEDFSHEIIEVVGDRIEFSVSSWPTEIQEGITGPWFRIDSFETESTGSTGPRYRKNLS